MSDDQSASTSGLKARRGDETPMTGGKDSPDFVAWISEATAPIVGEDFFRRLVELLATGLEADTALITQCPEASRNRAETLGFWHRGEFHDNIDFDLTGTPCEHVIHDARFCFLPEGVSERFPNWAEDEGGVESFIGVPLLGPISGDVVGHIAIYDRHPMPDSAVVESMFAIIAARAGAEISRRRTEEQRAEQERLARARLHELARVSRRVTVSELTGAIAHEIRQPLTSIMSYLGGATRLLERSGLNPKDRIAVREGIDHAMKSAIRGEAIVERLRNWVGSESASMQRLEPRALLEGIESMLKLDLPVDHIELTCEATGELPIIKGDPVLLEQVLFNLVRNAAEAIDRSARHTGRIQVEARRGHPNLLAIEVSDSGPGIPTGRVESIFEPFSGKRNGGMGIGLSLCRSIIESHDGRLELASNGNPTMFRITLPGTGQAATGTGGAPEIA
jgi:signal transduction histidine kinase